MNELQVIPILDWQTHPNDRLAGHMIIRCCPKCQHVRNIKTTRRGDEYITKRFVVCLNVLCDEQPEACLLDDRTAIELTPIR
jgi:hypothetical protein